MPKLDPTKVIISRRDKLTGKHKALSLLLMFAFWGILLYLIRPVLIIAGWTLGYYIFDAVTHNDNGGWGALWEVLSLYMSLGIALGLVLWLWAAYNRYRFSGRKDKRRVPIPVTTTAELAKHFRLPTKTIAEVQHSRSAICHFDKSGNVIAWEYNLPEGVTVELPPETESAASAAPKPQDRH